MFLRNKVAADVMVSVRKRVYNYKIYTFRIYFFEILYFFGNSFAFYKYLHNFAPVFVALCWFGK